ncbi:MAG TPA: serine protease [Gemmataceae bacterium]|nr:serine protease [Gemmataceae bacterium]
MPRPLRWQRLVWALLAAILGLVLPLAGTADDRPVDENVKKLYHRLLRSSLWVAAPKGEPGPGGRRSWDTGTASLIDANRRLVLTNWHVVTERNEVFVCFPTYQGSTLVADRKFYLTVLGRGGGGRGRVIAREESKDLALIQMEVIPPGAMALPLARESVKPGDRVHSIGNPGQSDKLWVCSSHTVESVGPRKIRSRKGDREFLVEAELIIAEVPAQPGESGGPLINDRGELVGVTQGHLPEQEKGVYVDVKEVRALLEARGLMPKDARPVPAAVSGVVVPPKPPPTKPPDELEDEEQAAARRLRFARLLIDADKRPRAREELEAIIKTYPTTKAAAEARQLLQRLKF